MKHCRIFLIVTLLFFFAGCDCGKQLHRLSYRCPELFERKMIISSIVIPEKELDTVFVFSQGPTDTVITYQDNIIATIIRQYDTLKIYVRVPSDTVYVEIPVEVPRPVIEVKERANAMDGLKSLISWIIALLVLTGVFLIVVTVIIKQIKK